MKQTVYNGLDAILYIDEEPVAGQEGASLYQQMSPIEITNKITGEWRENIGGLKNWSIICDGTYIKNLRSFEALEQAFLNNTKIHVSLNLNNKRYFGECLIIDFPLTAVFNTQFKYKIKLLGTGELKNGNNNNN